jgi:hypothetical protein
VYSYIILKSLERSEELIRVMENIDSDEEVCGVLVILLKELIESV